MGRQRVVLKSLEELTNTKGVIISQNNIGFWDSTYSFPNEYLLKSDRELIIDSEGGYNFWRSIQNREMDVQILERYIRAGGVISKNERLFCHR